MSTRRRSSRLKTGPMDVDSGDAASQADSNVNYTNLNFPTDFPYEDLQSLLPPDASIESPSPETMMHIYLLLVDLNARAEQASEELDSSKAEYQKLEVEAEQAQIDNQNEVSRMNSNLLKLSGDVKDLKRKEIEWNKERDALQSQLNSASSTHTTSSSEMNALRRENEETQRANRDLIAIADRMRVNETEQQQEIDSLRERLKTVRQEVSHLQNENAELKSSDATTKFKLETLNQELILLRSESERNRTDLDAKIEEFALFRRTKHGELVNLQTELSTCQASLSSVTTQFISLQSSNAEQTQHYTEALHTINSLKSSLAEQESKFRSELSTQTRLVALLESRNEDARKRVEEVDEEWEKMVKAADEREGELKFKLEREREKVDALEGRVDDLRAVIDKIGSGELPAGGDGSRAGTPNGHGSMVLSPTANLASRFQKSGRSFTDVYADYVRLQAELAAEKQESARLGDCLAQILADIEERAPSLHEQRLEYERIQRELARLGPQLDDALQERDHQARLARQATDRADATERENALLDRQLSDLSRQLRNLLRELALRDDPSLAMEEDTGDRSMVVEDMTDTDALITDKLTLYQSTAELQEQNRRLMRVVRELAKKAEEQEQANKQNADEKEGEAEAVRRAKTTIEGLMGKIKAMENKERSLRQQVDMLEGMIGSKPHYHPPAAPVNGDTMVTETERIGEMASLLKEMGANSGRLQEELSHAQKQASSSSVQLAKANAQIDFLNERHRLFDQTNEMQRRELTELQSRCAEYRSQVATLETAYRQAQDQAHDGSAMLDRLRSELANLRAEKTLLKDVETRLSNDVANLNRENARLNSLLRDTQTIQNDVHRAGESERRRMETTIQSLENQTQVLSYGMRHTDLSGFSADLRNQVTKELERNRHLALQKEVEAKEMQSKIESAMRELASTRESFVVAQANEKHLNTRIQDLVRTIEGNSEKLAVYERRPAGAAFNIDDISAASDLQREVAELRASLRGAELDAETARAHAEQFQAISATNEQALVDLQETYDRYKESMTAELTAIEAQTGDLQTRAQNLEEQLAATSETKAALEQQLEEQRVKFEAEKRELEYALADVNNAESSAATLQESVQEDLRRQARLAQEAHEKYERELLGHAEAVRTVSELKQKLTQVESLARDHQSTAETAQTNLASSQSSWEVQRETFIKELHDMKIRYEELSNQNDTLHKHLESVSAQATTIRQAADERINLAEGSTEAGAAPGSDDPMRELREVVAYLRREKEIGDLQLDLSRQEGLRLRSQVDQLTKSIDEMRTRLTQEREQAANSARSAAQHSDLLDKINQLNILRESNSTLRSENEANASKVLQLTERLRTTLGQMEPLKSELAAARAELSVKADQVAMLEGETERWRARNTHLLSQYKQVDPEDLRLAKEEGEELRKQADALRTECESLSRQKEKLQGSFTTLRTQSKTIIDRHLQTIANVTQEKEQLTARIAELEAQSTDVTATLELSALRDDVAQKTLDLAAAEQKHAALEHRLAETARSNTNGMDVDGSTLQTAKAELAASTARLNELQTSHNVALKSWEAEKADLEVKFNQANALQEKHKVAARGFLRDLRAAQKALKDAGVPFAVPAKPGTSDVIAAPSTANVPAKPLVVQSAPAAPIPPVPSPAPTFSVVPTPPAVQPKIESTSSEVPLVVPAPGPIETEEGVVPEANVVVPHPAPGFTQPLPTPVAAPQVPIPAAETVVPAAAPAALLDRGAMLRERLAKARQAQVPAPTASSDATPSEEPAIPTASSSAAAPSTVPGPANIAPTPVATARGRGRGAPRGARGALASAGRGRGAAATTTTPTTTTPPASGGLSISGAAKRPMDEVAAGDPTTEAGGPKRMRVQRGKPPSTTAAPDPAS